MIYIFIEEHRNRLDRFKASPAAIDFQPKYKVCGNRLVPEKPRFYDSLFSVADFKFHYNYKYKYYYQNYYGNENADANKQAENK